MLDHASPDFDIPGGGPTQVREGGVQAEELFDGLGDHLGPAAQQGEDLGLAAETQSVNVNMPEGAGRGFQPAGDERDQHPDGLFPADRLPVDLGLDYPVDHVVFGAEHDRERLQQIVDPIMHGSPGQLLSGLDGLEVTMAVSVSHSISSGGACST